MWPKHTPSSASHLDSILGDGQFGRQLLPRHEVRVAVGDERRLEAADGALGEVGAVAAPAVQRRGRQQRVVDRAQTVHVRLIAARRVCKAKPDPLI